VINRRLARFWVFVGFILLNCPLPIVLAKTNGAEPGLNSKAQPGLVLVTLDTTRADALGPRRSGDSVSSVTSVLDALATSGVRYTNALTPSPLTLPAHASMMTGLIPPGHGVRNNGLSALPEAIPTLATVLSAKGYLTAAFIASRVLDRRFGLAHGFDVYDDQMTAEKLGEYGYPERNAEAVTSAALAWLASAPSDRPFFLWVHYYDAHAPYHPPGIAASASVGQRYYGEVAFMDREIGRLLSALSLRSGNDVIAVAGDHGESLGEHGEQGHGIFLYGSTLKVPLIIAGRGVPQGKLIDQVVSIHQLPVTLLHLVDDSRQGNLKSKLPGAGLPGIPGLVGSGATSLIYSETQLPATSYGWAPIQAVSDRQWRLIAAPRPELYDLLDDPGETRNVVNQNRDQVSRLLAASREFQRTTRAEKAPAVPRDASLDRALRSLGYLGSTAAPGSIDPKDGVRLLDEFEQVRILSESGNQQAAIPALQELVHRNPRNITFLSHLAEAQLASGDVQTAISNYSLALTLNPQSEFLHLNLAEAYRKLARNIEAREAYEKVIQINPRSGTAWIRLAEEANKAGKSAGEQRLLQRAIDSGTNSGVVYYRLGQIESGKGHYPKAIQYFRYAIELIPRWPSPWMAMAKAQEDSRQFEEARLSYLRTLEIKPRHEEAQLGLSRVTQIMDGVDQ